jgi:hypothetical protein
LVSHSHFKLSPKRSRFIRRILAIECKVGNVAAGSFDHPTINLQAPTIDSNLNLHP